QPGATGPLGIRARVRSGHETELHAIRRAVVRAGGTCSPRPGSQSLERHPAGAARTGTRRDAASRPMTPRRRRMHSRWAVAALLVGSLHESGQLGAQDRDPVLTVQVVSAADLEAYSVSRSLGDVR